MIEVLPPEHALAPEPELEPELKLQHLPALVIQAERARAGEARGDEVRQQRLDRSRPRTRLAANGRKSKPSALHFCHVRISFRPFNRLATD